MIIIPMIVSFVNITLYSHWTILVCPCLHCRNPVFFFSGAVKVQYLFWKTFLFYFFGIGLHWQEFFILIGFRSSTFYQYSSILFFFYCISLPLVLKFCISYSSFLLFFFFYPHTSSLHPLRSVSSLFKLLKDWSFVKGNIEWSLIVYYVRRWMRSHTKWQWS